MCCDYYAIYYNEIVIAEKMTLETALLLLKALMTEYWKETDIQYTLKKMPQPYESNCCVERGGNDGSID